MLAQQKKKSLEALSLFGQTFLVTQFSSLITLHSSLKNTMFVWHHHSLPITQYFSHYLWAPYLSSVQLLFFLFFFSVHKLTNPVKKKKMKANASPGKEKKEKKRKKKNESQCQAKKKKKKKKSQRQPKKKKKKSKGGQKLRLWVSYVCLITILPLSYEL